MKNIINKIKDRYNQYKLSIEEDLFQQKLSLFIDKNSSYKGKPIVFWDMGGFDAILKKNAIFSKALNIRGYKTLFVICDGTPKACIQRGLEKKEIFANWHKSCQGCLNRTKGIAKKYNLNYIEASKLITENIINNFDNIANNIKINEIIKFKYLGINVGELAWSSINRYMKGFLVDIQNLKFEDEKIYRKYFYAVLINTYVASTVFKKYNPISLVTSHGVYVDYAPPVFLALRHKIKVVSWASGYADFLHYFTIPKNENKLELRGITDFEWNRRIQRPLTIMEKNRMNAYFHQRYFNSKATDINIISKPEEKNALRIKLNIKDTNQIVCLFAHLSWDACFDLGTAIFDNPNKWVIESIKKMITITNVHWIIRVHPGEITDGSLYTTSELIKENFPVLPKHISILWHDSDINPYGLYNLIDIGITIFGTVGAELPLWGKPIIAAGNAHFSNKGFSIDAKNKEEYFKILENAASIHPLTPEQVDLAKKYAYSYFIQRQIPLNIIDRAQGHWGDIDLNRLEELLPGKDPVLDKLCDGIVNGTDVILD